MKARLKPSRWEQEIKKHYALELDGRNAKDYPERNIAYRGSIFGWILSREDKNGHRELLIKIPWRRV